ncbi:MAG: hypothetical protein IIX93_07460, partial [Clostridia bacterium]|nr:hypothetical protein [Clostridia bacterium]
MKRESCMLKVNPGMLPALVNEIHKREEMLQAVLVKLGAKNASAWTVEGYLYIYADFEDDNEKGLKDLMFSVEYDLLRVASYVA